MMNDNIFSNDTTGIERALNNRSTIVNIKKTIWLTRPDLCDLVRYDIDCFDFWLFLHGSKEYEALNEFNNIVSNAALTESAAEAFDKLSPRLTRFMSAIWKMRPDLKEAFDLRIEHDQQNFVWWYFLNGVTELGLVGLLTIEQYSELLEPDRRYESTSFTPLTRLMVEVWNRRPDLQLKYNLADALEQESFIRWYFIYGIVEFNLVQYVSEQQAQNLWSLDISTNEAYILRFLWESYAELRSKFSSPIDDRFREWAMGKHGQKRFVLLHKLSELARPSKQMRNFSLSFSKTYPSGVNLIGYAKGQFGIGEDVRMAARALDAAEIPFSVFNIEPGKEVDQCDTSILEHVSKELPYDTNMFCTTGIETARLAAEQGSRLFDGRHTIGYWPWELPDWPMVWNHAYDLVDEVWASSQFTYEAFVKSCPRPVKLMPMAVSVDQTANLTRRDFALPEDRFLFVFSFDFLSSLARKNPQACVEAFQRAFPSNNEPVGLVIKAMRVVDNHPTWREIVSKTLEDERIILITSTVSKGAVLDLYRSCDCFLSLHRSEGFGRGMAEAMMLGKPVVATGFSGNTDFTTTETAGLVNFVMRRLQSCEYSFGDHSEWAEPDLEHAAWWMREIVQNRKFRRRMAIAGQNYVKCKYSPDIIGRIYRRSLESALM